jgi:hypothetical protein
MKCTGGRVVRFLVCLQVFRPSPVISNVRVINQRLSSMLLIDALEVGPFGFIEPQFPGIRI